MTDADSADSQVPTLCDGVILLNALTPEDAEAHTAGEDEEMARRFGWYPNWSTVEGVRAYFAANENAWHDGSPRRAWAVRDASTRMLVGGCELRLKEQETAHMSWWVFPDHRRRGFASRAVRLAAEYAFEYLTVRQLEAFIALDNVASRGVARNVGFLEAELVYDGDQQMLRHVLLADVLGCSD